MILFAVNLFIMFYIPALSLVPFFCGALHESVSNIRFVLSLIELKFLFF